MHYFAKSFGIYFIVSILLIGGLILFIFIEKIPPPPQYESVMETKKFMTNANQIKRKGFFIDINSDFSKICAERPIPARHSEHQYHRHFQSYCLEKNGWIPIQINWPEVSEQDSINKEMIKQVSKLARRYGF